MRQALLVVLMVTGLLPQPAGAVACGAGPYRAGCVGPNGAVVTRRAYVPPPRHGTVTCARGHYRAGCVGPNGAVVRHY